MIFSDLIPFYMLVSIISLDVAKVTDTLLKTKDLHKYLNLKPSLNLQGLQGEAFDKAINSNSFAKEAYADAVNCIVDMLLQAHSPYTNSLRQKHALLALNHVRLRGKVGDYLKQVIEAINYEHFDTNGFFKAAHSSSAFKYAANMLIPLFQYIAHDKEKYHSYLDSLEHAFVSSNQQTKISREISKLIKEERTKEFKQATDSEFTTTLNQVLPALLKERGKREQSVIANNNFNKEFINLFTTCLIDIADPLPGLIGSLAKAESLISSCKNKQYQQSMREFYEDIRTKLMSNNKQQTLFPAERYQQNKRQLHALGIPEPKDETINKLFYIFLIPITQAKH
jgi:hypothetical protein